MSAVDSVHRDDPTESQARGAADHVGVSSVAASGTAAVLAYIDSRSQAHAADVALTMGEVLEVVQALRLRVAELEGAEGRARALQRTVELLNERIRELEIGFRRHVSERVSLDQLQLVLTADAPTEPPTTTPDAGIEPSPPAASPAPEAAVDAPPSGSDPEPEKRKKRHAHGRRRLPVIPKVIIEILPIEVQSKGIAQFKRIGHEDSSTLGHRRGGPIELISRRVKFVPIVASDDIDADESSPTPPVVAPSLVPASRMDTTVRDKMVVVLEHEVSGDTDAVADEFPPKPPVAAPSLVPASRMDTTVVVVEHGVAMVPADTAFKNNPFIDGAVVCYTPESTDADSRAGPVLIAPVRERPIARSLVDASLLAHLLVHKFDYHTPFYRQEVEASRQGCPNSRANMCRWQFEAGRVLMRIADAAWDDALKRSWFGMDATGTAIQAKDKFRYGHVVALVAPGDSVLFRYSPTYDSATVQKLFGGYTGTVVADASANHNVLFGPGKGREGGCWAHARKPFFKAFKAGEGKLAAFALQTIQALFRIEEKVALLSPEARLEVRQRESAPLVAALFAWVDRELPSAPAESLVRKGLGYLKNQKQALSEFLQNGEIPIHNNACERALRRIVKGRQNWLAHGSDDHAQRACAITSLIASCQLHGLDPEFYLQEVLTVAPSWCVKRMLELTPKHWIATRQRLIAEGRLKYIDLAQIAGSRFARPTA